MSEELIFIKNISEKEIIKVLEDKYFLNFNINRRCIVMGIKIDIFDLTVEFEYTRKFLQENGLQDQQSFFREFDMKDYNIVIDISTDSWIPSCCYSYVIADQVGKYLSLELKTYVAILFEDGEVPFCVYENGVRTIDLEKYYKNYFLDKDWIPNSIL